jgi:hypothetical protein
VRRNQLNNLQILLHSDFEAKFPRQYPGLAAPKMALSFSLFLQALNFKKTIIGFLVFYKAQESQAAFRGWEGQCYGIHASVLTQREFSYGPHPFLPRAA